MLKKDIVLKREVKSREIKSKEKVNRLEQARQFFRSVYSELKKVHWPARREVLIYTGVVLTAVTFVGVLIWIFDSVLSWLLRLIVK